MTPQPQTPPRPAAKLMHIVEGLTDVLEDEITLLEKHDYARHAALLKQKQELTLNYQTSLRLMKENPEKGKLLSPEERSVLEKAGQKLQAVTMRNAEALRLAQAVSERLLQSMMEEVRKGLQKESGYSREAMLTAAEKGAVRPVALNRRV